MRPPQNSTEVVCFPPPFFVPYIAPGLKPGMCIGLKWRRERRENAQSSVLINGLFLMHSRKFFSPTPNAVKLAVTIGSRREKKIRSRIFFSFFGRKKGGFCFAPLLRPTTTFPSGRLRGSRIGAPRRPSVLRPFPFADNRSGRREIRPISRQSQPISRKANL